MYAGAYSNGRVTGELLERVKTHLGQGAHGQRRLAQEGEQIGAQFTVLTRLRDMGG